MMRAPTACTPAPWSRAAWPGAGAGHRRRHGRGPHWCSLAATETPRSPLQLRSRRLVRALGALALLLATAQVLLGWWWNGRPLLDSLLAGIALAMAILPEEIPVILTVFLAWVPGALRASRY